MFYLPHHQIHLQPEQKKKFKIFSMTRAKHKKFKSSLSNSFDMNFWYILFIWGENLIIQRREREGN